MVEESHFLSTPDEFAEFRAGRKRLVMEDWYRSIRKRTGLLMTADGKPVGGQWNYDKDNRQTFGKDGPGLVPPRLSWKPDERTQAVIEMVERHFADSPGKLDDFEEPVTREQGLEALDDFIDHRLRDFGRYQDALWEGATTLFHSRLSTALNFKLIDPRECCEAAVRAYEEDRAPLNAVEGFVRQIIGWREFIRGIYWTEMPGYAGMNALDADEPVPALFWTGETEMACLRDVVGRLVHTGYAHHIERLMVLGLYLQLHGTNPYAAHEWHVSMYLDSIDWASLPNMLGMSQHGDGGIVGTKPYCASGAYIDRMSNYCGRCRFKPKEAVGEDACPFTTLYWDFLDRHADRFRSNRRMALQVRNLERKDPEELDAIRRRARDLRDNPR